jgi:hypothetical protein
MRETSIVYGPIETANLKHWPTHPSITAAIYIPETRLCRREITGKYEMKIVIKASTELKLR